MDPVVALRQIAYYKDRAREDSRRVMAFVELRNAAEDLGGGPLRAALRGDLHCHGAA